ncbi:cation diffusion facilitator family transporter [Acetobacterium bakii]|uniref:Cation diffusion facilitator family transporter n=1 Tax=Acetobacterium bakii TaxID=52689 RepID=A0A0L6U3S8_9FIRM|nr:cation diffusion facilitator family transporter [Acetobacterium bakii]KNZ43171.1 cation diffusion facilitator family transporter [Acetobacterium bakii]
MINRLIKIFVKNYEKTANPQVRESYGKLASIFGIASNLVLFLSKITVGFLSNSISITADAVNNLSDFGSSIVTLVGFKIAGKPADAEHPYGHERIEYISGLIVSFIVLFLGLQLILNSIDKIMHPQMPEFSMISLFVLIMAILIKCWQYVFYQKIGKIIDSVSLLATSIDSRNDILATSAVLIAAIITYLTGFNLDGYMGVVVALFIIISGIRLVIDTANPILGTAPTKEMVDTIYKKILSYDNIIGLHDLNIHSYGATKFFASVHCEVPAEQNIIVSHEIIDTIERDFLKDLGIHLVIHLDPVVTNDGRTNDLKDNVEGLIEKISPDIRMHDFRVVWGKNYSNLIFDIVVPFDINWSDDDLKKSISEEIYRIDYTYHSVIIVDHYYYIPEEDELIDCDE